MSSQRWRVFEYKFIKFITVGVTSTLVNYIVFVCLINLEFHYAFSMPVGFCIGLAVGYYFNNIWTFNTSIQRSSLFRYLTVYSVTLLVGLGLLTFLVEFITLDTYMANATVLVVTTILNYTGLKWFVFK